MRAPSASAAVITPRSRSRSISASWSRKTCSSNAARGRAVQAPEASGRAIQIAVATAAAIAAIQNTMRTLRPSSRAT
jgi:hypothetical protein